LDLSENGLKSIHGNLFSELSKLITLRLCTNQIEVIHEAAFNGLGSLKYLNMHEKQKKKTIFLEEVCFIIDVSVI
jgi:hypothetical protein